MVDSDKTDEEWRAELGDARYNIVRCGGTEMAFTGEYWDTKTAGTYHCSACDAPLYSSETKYDSGSGWPSFWEALDKSSVKEKRDSSHGMERVEATCAICDSHLGHVFMDGPEPTGLRHCINSASLKLVES